jgi:hypothetical protein
VQLDVLPGRDIGEVARVLPGQVADDAKLVRGQHAVRQADTHHEEFGRLADSVLAAGYADSIALGVDAPPLEVELGPLRHHGGAAFAGELANLVPGGPRILGELEPLRLLGLGFLGSWFDGLRRRCSEVGHKFLGLRGCVLFKFG